MRKTFISLLLAAVGVWTYVLLQLLFFWMSKTTPLAVSDSGKNSDYYVQGGPGVFIREPVRFDSSLRDPFQSFLYAQKPASPPSARPKIAVPIKAIEPPRAVLGGVLWGPNPVAILKLEGKTELVKAGAVVWDIKVKRVDRHQVIVVKEGREFSLSY